MKDNTPAVPSPQLSENRSSDTLAPITPEEYQRARETYDAARASNTRRAYKAAWQNFHGYCRQINADALPADPATVVLFLNHLAWDQHRAPSTITLHLAAIRWFHEDAGTPSPTLIPAVRETMRGIRRQSAANGWKPDRKDALTLADLQRTLAALPQSSAGTRDRALLAIGLWGAFRRSELVALNIEDVEFTDAGATIDLHRSKTDQEGNGLVKVFPRRTGLPICPVAALDAWLTLRRNDEPSVPLFVPINRHGGIAAERRLSDRDIYRIIQRRLQKAGIDTTALTAHSLRIGFVTEARRKGIPAPDIMNQTGHKTTRMIETYTRRLDAWEANAATKL